MEGDHVSRCLNHPEFRKRYKDPVPVGGGAFGVILKAHCPSYGPDYCVAIKVPKLDKLDNNTDGRERFQNEARLAAKLSHPNVVRINTVFVDEAANVQWIEMEWVEGTNLADEIARRAPERFSVEEAIEIGLASATALAVAHEADVVHRDVKPANFLVPTTRKPPVKLGDFGISRGAGQEKKTATGVVVGSPMYLSPEAANGEQQTSASDIYQLGIVFYDMLSGNRPCFSLPANATIAAWAFHHGYRNPTPLREHAAAAGVPAELEGLIVRMLQKPQQKRPTAQEVVETLAAIQQTLKGAPAVSTQRRTPAPAMAASVGAAMGRAKVPILGAVGVAIIVLALALRPRGGTEDLPNSGSAEAARLEAAAPDTRLEPGRVELPAGAAPSENGGGSSAQAQASKQLRVALVGDELQVSNGGDALRSVELELVGADKATYRMSWPETIEAGQLAGAVLLGFNPTPPPGATFTKAIVRAQTATGPRVESFSLQ